MRPFSRETIFSSFKSIAVLIFFGFGLIWGSNALAWIGPTGAPPDINVDPPLNQGTPFGGNGSATGLANSNVIGKYNDLKISINPCFGGQVLMWSTSTLASGQVICGNPTLNVSLLDVLTVDPYASSYEGGIIMGTTEANWMNLGGAFTASWIHATGTGDNTFAGNLLVGGKIGLGIGSPNAQLHVYNDFSTSHKNAEIDIQSVTGANNHWAIYHEASTTNLIFWNKNGNNPDNDLRFVIGANGNTYSQNKSYASDFCIYGSKCLGELLVAGIAGATATTDDGNQGGYTGANGKCAASYARSHVCTLNEILDSINSGASLLASGDYWVSNGTPEVTQSTNDCEGWTDGSGSNYGVVWTFNSTGGKSGLRTCDDIYKTICCD